MIQRILLRALVAIIVFAGSVFVVDKLNNQGYSDVSIEMDEPMLPVVYCSYEGTMLNRLAGYKHSMNTKLMRECIIPVNTDNGVEILVDDRYEYATGYGYELRSIGDNSLVEYDDLDVEKTDKFNGYIQFSFDFRMNLKEDQEYVLVFIIKNGDEEVKYYTRVVKKNEEYISKMLEYVLDFNKATFVKEVPEDQVNVVKDNLKYDETATNNNLSYVSLSSNYDQVTWALLEPIRITSLVPSLMELDDTYAVFGLEYAVVSEVGEKEAYFNVNECYSVNYNKNTQDVELLAFDRHQESIFDESEISKSDNGFKIGIANQDEFKYKSTDDGKKVAFVREGQLWFYNYNDTTMTNVFSFWQSDLTDIRTTNRNLDINIISITDDNEIVFVVYGYMSRGVHEGQNGLALYKYNGKERNIEELSFVQTSEPFAVMQQQIGRFTYFDEEESKLYYLLNESIYCVDLVNEEQISIINGIPSNYIKTSDSMKVIAYPNTDVLSEVTEIKIYNFEQKEENIITAPSGERIMPVGFVGEDVIFGTTKSQNVIISSDEETTFPMNSVSIIDYQGNVLKEYKRDNVYVMNAYLKDEVIYLTRATQNGNFYEYIEPDYISYKKDINAEPITLKNNYTTEKKNQLYMVFPSNVYVQLKPELVITKLKNVNSNNNYEVDEGTNKEYFYVFDNTGYKGEYFSAGKSITQVQESEGVVIDSDGNTIFRKIDGKGYNTVASSITKQSCGNKSESLMACAYMSLMLTNFDGTYEEVKEVNDWKQAFELFSNKIGINISGITLDGALYFLDRDIPFAALLEDGRYVLVISYNDDYIRYYDPIEDKEERVLRDEFEDNISQNSNTMYTFSK